MAEDLAATITTRYEGFYNAVLHDNLKQLSEYLEFSEKEMMDSVPSMMADVDKLSPDQKKQALSRLQSMQVNSFDALHEPTNAFKALIKATIVSNYPDPKESRWISTISADDPNTGRYGALMGKTNQKSYAVTFFYHAHHWKGVGWMMQESNTQGGNTFGPVALPVAFSIQVVNNLRKLEK